MKLHISRSPENLTPDFAIIGGSGLTQIENLDIVHRQVCRSRWGEPSAPVTWGRLGDATIAFLPRHGSGHTIAPHRVNYRANIQVLHDLGVRKIVAVTAVGGIREDLGSGSIVIPHDIVDYTWGREHTYFGGHTAGGDVTHVDFTHPYAPTLRRALEDAARSLDIGVATSAVYAATQGPRFESPAEIDRIETDGGDIVGMTGMPEASLAAELGLAYANISVVVNPAAGRAPEGVEISLESIYTELEQGMSKVRSILAAAGADIAKL